MCANGMAGSRPPLTESDLAARLPPSNSPGLLRRDLLPPGERVLFETRPSLWGLYWGRLIVLLLLLLFFVAVTVGAPLDAIPGLAFFEALFVIALVLTYLGWRNRVYALTNQRVIRVFGIRGTGFQDAAYSQITNMTLEGGASLRFDTTPFPTGYGSPSPPATRILWWESLPDGARVYTFVQEAFAVALREATQTAAVDAAVARTMGPTITCNYCGGPIDVATLDAANPRCPRCSAPVTLYGG